MKTLAACLVSVLALSTLAAADKPKEPTAAEKAIADSVEALKKAAAVETDPASKKKLLNAIRYLEASQVVPENDNGKLADFVDNPANYKGKTMTFEMRMEGDSSLSIRDLADVPLYFTARVGQKGSKVEIHAVASGKVVAASPKVHPGDTVIVTIKCNEGDALRGNDIISVKRP